MALSDIWLTKQVDGYQESYTTEGAKSTVSFLSTWANRISWRNTLYGSKHSDVAALSDCVCTSVTMEPRGWTEGATTPTYALLTAQFDTNPKDKPPDPDVPTSDSNDWENWKESWACSGEALSVGGGFKWMDDNTPVNKKDLSITLYVPTITLTLSGKLYYTTTCDIDIGKQRVLDTAGWVNSDTVTIKGFPYVSDTLLFLGASFDEGVDKGGNTTYDVTMNFLAKTRSWNDFWRDDPKIAIPYWVRMEEINQAGAGPYLARSFAKLNPPTWV